MWNRARSFVQSFSFRAGALIFITFCVVLLTMRVLIYIQAIHSTRSDIKEIILAHSEAIQANIKKDSISYIENNIQKILDDTHDKNLVIAFRNKNGEIIGSIQEWPVVANQPGKYWIDFPLDIENYVSDKEDIDNSRDIMANMIVYSKGRSLLVGYDLKRLEIMKHALWMALVVNASLSFAAAFLLTWLMIFMLNRHMRKLNITCTEVMQGNNAHRVKLSGADDEFERLGKNLNAMLDRNVELLNVVRESTNALAHDMRTPLSRLRISLQGIIEKPETPVPVQEDLAESVGQIDKLAEMFQNILSIAKAESLTRTDDIFGSFDIVAIIRNIVDFYATFIEDKKQLLETQIPQNEIIFRGDRQLIAQAILNLLDNAVKYTPKKGHISVTLERQDNAIICTIADSGPGIPEDFRDKVKERFFRMDESRSAEGSGLGMSLVEAVAKLHRGELRLMDNNPGLKAMFILPVV